MATTSGAVQNFQNVDVILGNGHRVDAYDDAGIVVAWQGDRDTVSTGPDNKNIHIETGNSYAIVTLNLKANSRSLPYIDAWIEAGDLRTLVLQDRNGATVLAEARARPRQKPNMTFNGSANALPIDIHCPNFTGQVSNLAGS